MFFNILRNYLLTGLVEVVFLFMFISQNAHFGDFVFFQNAIYPLYAGSIRDIRSTRLETSVQIVESNVIFGR